MRALFACCETVSTAHAHSTRGPWFVISRYFLITAELMVVNGERAFTFTQKKIHGRKWPPKLSLINYAQTKPRPHNLGTPFSSRRFVLCFHAQCIPKIFSAYLVHTLAHIHFRYSKIELERLCRLGWLPHRSYSAPFICLVFVHNNVYIDVFIV